MFLTATTSFLGSTLGTGVVVLLLIIALIGGACITIIGPGGIFVTIALFVLLPLDPGTVAGTASATFIATGIAGSLGYLKSGQLRNRKAIRAALVLSLASVAGAYAGTKINQLLDSSSFGLLLGIFVFLTGVIVLYRRYNTTSADSRLKLDTARGFIWMSIVGLGVGFTGGLLGVGGPVLAVPLLVVLGVPMLLSVALAQVQSIFISGMATVGYVLQGAVNWKLAALLVVPLLIGTISGWYFAQRIQSGRLKAFLSLVLMALGIYLIAGGAVPGVR